MEINFLNYSSLKHPLNNGFFTPLSELPLEILSSKGFSGELLFYLSDYGHSLGSLKIFYSFNKGLNKIESYYSEEDDCYQIKNLKNGKIATLKPFFHGYSFSFTGTYDNTRNFIKNNLPKKYISKALNQEHDIISDSEIYRCFVIGFDTYIEPCFFSNDESESFSLSVEISSFLKYLVGG